jgi:hypothetical protein
MLPSSSFFQAGHHHHHLYDARMDVSSAMMDAPQGEQWPPQWSDNHAENSQAKHMSLKRKHDDHEKLDLLNPVAPVRRRISRACDKCNQLRTKV